MGRGLAVFVIVGPLVLVGLWWLWWDQFARSPIESKVLPARPAVVRVDAERLGAVLEGAPWVSSRSSADGADAASREVIYKIGFRACPDCINFSKTVTPDLLDAGVEVRILYYPPSTGRYGAGPAELAAVAAVFGARDWAEYRRWTEDANPEAYYRDASHPPVEGDPDRLAVIDATRRVHDEIAAVMRANGWDMERPAFFWRDDAGRWRAYMSDTPRGHRFVRAAMGVD